jgi:putative SOS response-associated peptidase YedK
MAMRGRFRLTRAAKLAERFGIDPEDDWVPRYDIARTQSVEVIRQHPEEPKRLGSQMRWGLIPFWAKDASIG